MQVDTYLFGAVEVSPEKIITFPNGLVGFEKCTRYMMVHEADTEQPASFTLQSLDNPALAFGIIDPTTLGFHYELALSETENALLQSPAAEDVAVMQMLYRKEEGGKAGLATNMRAPLIINTRARVGLQKVMEKVQTNITLSNLVSVV